MALRLHRSDRSQVQALGYRQGLQLLPIQIHRLPPAHAPRHLLDPDQHMQDRWMSPDRPITFNSNDEDAAKSKMTRANRSLSFTDCDVWDGAEEDSGVGASPDLVPTDAANVL